MELNVVWVRDDAARDCADRLLRLEVARVWGSSPRSVSVARLCGACGSSRHGRPYVLPYGAMPIPHVSISRAGPLAMVAATQSETKVFPRTCWPSPNMVIGSCRCIARIKM